MVNQELVISSAEAQQRAQKTLLDALRIHTEQHPEHLAYAFLSNGEELERSLSYQALAQEAQNLAAHLQDQGLKAGDRALLLYPQGLDFVVAFFACLYAGIIAIPAYPPRKMRADSRIRNITEDSKAAVALGSAEVFERLHEGTGLENIKTLATETLGSAPAAFKPVDITPDTLAFLQYTSGSTGSPKGVMVSHENVACTMIDLELGGPFSDSSVMVSWLPLFHDMGLIYGALLPVYFGIPCYLMPPAAFTQKPARWLMAITRYRGTHSAAPNFAYELCAVKISDEQRQDIDLSSWEYTINGAERVRFSTVQRFNTAFREQGLSPLTLSPGYGMAETALKVSGVPAADKGRDLWLDNAALMQNRVRILDAPTEQAFGAVSCGASHISGTIRIVNPHTLAPAAADEVGEIWVHGPMVAQGYWQRPDATQETFRATLSDEAEGTYFLRTGDLGFLHEGELYITGRIKEMMVIRGQNHYPQDVEQTAQQSHPALRPDGGAAFTIMEGSEERLVVLHELNRLNVRHFKGDEILLAVRQAIAEQHGLQLHALLLIKPSVLPKTTSGKTQRGLCREQFLKGEWTAKAVWQDVPQSATDGVSTQSVETRVSDVADDGAKKRALSALQMWIQQRISTTLRLPLSHIDPTQPMTSFGLDSSIAVGLSGELGEKLGIEVPPTLIYDYPTIQALAEHLLGVNKTLRPSSDSPADDSAKSRASSLHNEPIAIIGMACRLPGAENLDAFYTLLRQGVDAIRKVPAERWQATGEPAEHWGGFIDQADQFDAAFFGITSKEAHRMDPQQRLLLENAWRALEHANIDPLTLAGSLTGVFVGISTADYQRLQLQHGVAPDVYYGTGNALCVAANRLSYTWDLRGPSLAIDTACSSSLVAIHQACSSLRNGDSDLALAGGVNLMLSPDLHDTFSQAGMLSPEGRCKTFDAAANGYVRGEGCGLVVLKRLSEAEQDGDKVLAVIRGGAVNQDGRSNGLTAPNSHAQQAVVRAAFANAHVSSADIGYVEAHGTGTTLGDPIEFNALKAVLSDAPRHSACKIGSVKTNIGHLESAAGVAGLIKTVLSLQKGEFFPHLHYSTPNPLLEQDENLLRVSKGGVWNEEQRYASISGFGFGGTNAHLVLSSVATQSSADELPTQHTGTKTLMPLSAKTPEALQQLAQDVITYLQAHPKANLADIAFSSHTARAHFRQRLAIVSDSPAHAIERLNAFVAQKTAAGMYQGKAGAEQQPPMVFLFTGQGAQHPGMGRDLYDHFPLFKQIIDECDQLARAHLSTPLLSVMYPGAGDDENLVHQTEYTQPTLFAVEYATARLWMAAGIEPAAVIGHSIGEYVAACIAGVFSLEDALLLVIERARLMGALPQTGGMVTVFADVDTVRAAIAPYAPRLGIATMNSPANTVVSGDISAIEAFLGEFAVTHPQIETRVLKVSNAFHSALMEPMLDEFEQRAAQVTYQAPRIPLMANLTGQAIDKVDAHYWRRHTREAVNFSGGLQTLLDQGYTNFIEVGPRPVLCSLGEEIAAATIKDSEALSALRWLPSLHAKKLGSQVWLGSLAQLYVSGVTLDGHALAALSATTPQTVSLPGYPFQRQSHWLPALSRGASTHQPRSISNIAQTIVTVSQEENMNPPNAEDRTPRLLSELIDITAEVLETDASSIESDVPLLEMGADSLVIAQVVRKIEAKYGLNLSIRQFFEELNTLAALAAYVDAQLPAEAVSTPPASPAEAAQPAGGMACWVDESIQQSNATASPATAQTAPTTALPDNALERILSQQMSVVSSTLSDVVAQQLAFLGKQELPVDPKSNAGVTQSVATGIPTQSVGTRATPATVGRVSDSVTRQPTQQSTPSALPAWKPKDIKMRGMSEQQREYMAAFTARYTRKTPGSKQLTQQYRSVLSDSRASAGFRLSVKEMVYPIVGDRARGSKTWDVDGNEYIDITMGFGVNLFGHQPPFVVEALEQQLHRTMQLGLQTPLAGEVADLICELTGLQRVTFCNSGTEAVMTALRLARAATRKNKVVNFIMSYHGHFDGVLGEPEEQGTEPAAPGVCPGMVEDIIPLKYDDPASLDYIRAHIHELAAVLVEPVQSRHPELQPREFLQELRRITREAGVVLILDEMITGFRIHPGGAQAWFDVDADIATYGKIVGGGMPIGVVAGKAQYMDGIDGGFWQYGDDSYPQADTTFFAGTFCKHPLAMAAAKAVLLEIKKQGASLQETLNQRTAVFAQRLNDWFEAGNVPIHIVQFGSLFRFVYSGNLDMLYYHLIDKGLYVWEGRNCFLSTAHSEADVEFVIAKIQETVLDLHAGGFLPEAQPLPVENPQPIRCALTAAQQHFWAVCKDNPTAVQGFVSSLALHVAGEIRQDYASAAAHALMQRHQSLRTVMDADTGEALILPEVPLSLVMGEADAVDGMVDWLEDQVPFDVVNGPLWRWCIVKASNGEHWLVLQAHHLITDGMSMSMILEEFATLYNAAAQGQAAPLPPAAQWQDFMRYKTAYQNSAEREEDAAFWREKLAGGYKPAHLPEDFERPDVFPHPGERYEISLSAETFQQLSNTAKTQQCTPFMMLAATFTLMFHRINGDTADSLPQMVAFPVSGRFFDDGETMTGNSAHPVPLLTQLQSDEQTFAEYLQYVRGELFEVYKHQQFSARDIAASAPAKQPFKLPAVRFNFDRPQVLEALNGVPAHYQPLPLHYMPMDLFLDVLEWDDTWQLRFEYPTDIYSAEHIQQLAADFIQLLQTVCSDHQVLLKNV